MKMHRNLLLSGLFFTFLMIVAASCKKDKDEELLGNWSERSVFEGVARSDATVFTIGNIAYVGTGYDGEERLTDFWSYDPSRNSWTQIADFPGVARNAATAFGAAGKGYVGTGYDGEQRLGDFWQYDPGSNTWEQAADFGGSARYGAVAFTINEIGYVGTGYDGNYLKDFWAYDPGSNTWTQKNSYGGAKRRDAVGFVISGKGYICTGINNGDYERDLYVYDPGTDLWTAKRKIYPVSDEGYDDDYTIVRSNAVAFAMGGKAYIATGTVGSLKNDVWEYDPANDLWEAKTNFEGSTRTDAVAFSTEDGRAYVTTGKSSTAQFDDTWEFRPNDKYEKED